MAYWIVSGLAGLVMAAVVIAVLLEDRGLAAAPSPTGEPPERLRADDEAASETAPVADPELGQESGAPSGREPGVPSGREPGAPPPPGTSSGAG